MKRKRCLTCGDVHECINRRPKKLRLRLPGQNIRQTDCDEEEKLRRGYMNPRTRVRRDGSEVLHGEDWDKRKLELHERSDGACEMLSLLKREHAERCTGDMHHPHHIVKRSVRRDDRLSNLAGLSWACHKEADNRKVAARQIERISA